MPDTSLPQPSRCSWRAARATALEKLVATGRVRAADRVIVVSTANGLKSAEFKTGYHTGRLPGIAARQPSGRSYSRIFFLGVSRTLRMGWSPALCPGDMTRTARDRPRLTTFAQ
jgi:hypothetical protein